MNKLLILIQLYQTQQWENAGAKEDKIISAKSI